MSIALIELEEVKKAINDGRLLFTKGNDIRKGTAGQPHIHHTTVFHDEKGSKIPKYKFTLPYMKCSHITRQIPKDSPYATYFVYVDIYRAWPLGKRRGEDPEGDELFDFLRSLEDAYIKGLENDEETRNIIFTYTTQGSFDRNGQKIPITDISTVVSSSISFPVFPEGNPKAGQRDESKSPTFKIQLWTQAISDKLVEDIMKHKFFAIEQKKRGIPVNESTKHLLVTVKKGYEEECEDDPRRYLQQMFCKIFDGRFNPSYPKQVTSEGLMEEFIYSAGDAKAGKRFPLVLLADFDIISPTWYWASKTSAVLQLKACEMLIREKHAKQHNGDKSREEREIAHAKFLEMKKKYGIVSEEPGETGDEYGYNPYDQQRTHENGSGDGADYNAYGSNGTDDHYEGADFFGDGNVSQNSPNRTVDSSASASKIFKPATRTVNVYAPKTQQSKTPSNIEKEKEIEKEDPFDKDPLDEQSKERAQELKGKEKELKENEEEEEEEEERDFVEEFKSQVVPSKSNGNSHGGKKRKGESQEHPQNSTHNSISKHHASRKSKH